ncbi:MAG: O-antigen ligase family protein [Flavobacteriales bacterium]|nr:O-antigen ligase family protein [Flavobacteriales bacterium]
MNKLIGLNTNTSNSLIYKRKKFYDYALATLGLLMPLVVKGFPVLIIATAIVGIVYYFRAYQKLGKPKKDYCFLPYNLLKDGFISIFKKKGAPMFMVILFVFYLVSFFYSENDEVGAEKILLKSCYLYFPLIFTLTKWDKEKLERVLNFYIIGCVIHVLISYLDAFIQAGFSFILFEFTYTRLSFNLHPSYSALLINIALIFVIAPFLLKPFESFKKPFLVKNVVFIMLFIPFILLLSSKSGIFSLLLIVIVTSVFVLFKLRNLKFKIVFFLTLGCLILTLFLSDNRVAKRKYLELERVIISSPKLPRNKAAVILSTQIRLVLWENSFLAFKRSPLFGYGIGDGKDALQKQLKESEEEFVFKLKHNSHNQFLEIGLKLGFFGVLLFLIALCSIAFGFKDFNYFSFLIFLVLFFNLFVESMMEKQVGSIFIVWLLCLLFSSKKIIRTTFSLGKG